MDHLARDGKSLQNSTDTTLSLKNLQKKYVQKGLKSVQKQAKMPKNKQKIQNPKNITALKNEHWQCQSCPNIFPYLHLALPDSLVFLYLASS